MVTATALKPSLQTEPDEDQGVAKKIQQFRELFADAPELGKKALENVLQRLKMQISKWKVPAASAPASARCRS